MRSESDDREDRIRTQAVRPLPLLPISSRSASSDEFVIPHSRAQTPSNLMELVGDDNPSNEPRGLYLENITESPVSSPLDEPRSSSSIALSSSSRSSLTRSRPVKKSSRLSSGSSSASDLAAPDEFSTPSKRRWDDLRRHFLPSHLAARTANVQPSTTPPPTSSAPSHSSTPKQFRVPKPGLKQVVETAQEAVSDQTKKFADDILRASRAVSSNDVKVTRKEREGSIASKAASLNMAFMSSTTAGFGIASASVSSHLPQSRAKAMWRPPSLQSMATVYLSPSAAFTSLCNVISYYASIIPNHPHLAKLLPYEGEVLSSLLVPFMVYQSETADNERSQAVEAVEVIVKTWAASDESFLERCLWCCKVARMIPDQKDDRMRVLHALWSCLSSPEDPFGIRSPIILQTLFQALFSLQGSLLAEGDSEQASYVHGLINGVKRAGCQGLDASMLIQQYGVQLQSEADAHAILDCVIVMALAASTENATDGEHQHILPNLVAAKKSWLGTTGSSHYSMSLRRIETLSITQCSRALISFLLPSDDTSRPVEDFHLVFEILTEWLIPVANALVHNDSFECKVMSARLALHVLSHSGKETREVAVSLIGGWFRDHDQWKVAFEAAIQVMVKEDNWKAVVAVLTALMEQLPNELLSQTAMKFLPTLHEKLAVDLPPLPFPQFTEFLESISQKLPKLFYKPLFACAAGTKETSVFGHLRTVVLLARHLPSFWIRDAEMLLVAFMSDSSNVEKNPQGNAGAKWGQVRLGQVAILIELIAHVQATRQDKDSGATTDSAFLAEARFFLELEFRLGAIIDGKERKHLIPMAQRVLLVNLLFEIRLLLRSLKPAQWLSRVVSWVVSFEEDAQVAEKDNTSILETIGDVHSALQSWSPTPQKRKHTTLSSPSTSMDAASLVLVGPATVSLPLFTFFSRERQLKDFTKGFMSNSLRLLVLVSGLLSREDCEILCACLWHHCLTQATPETQILTTFLIMQGAEKAPAAILNVIKADIKSPDASRRLLAARRLSLMSGWRFQILSQEHIADKNYRRPFKIARLPTSFLPTDVGSSSFVLREDLATGNTVSGQVLPPELRKRLADIGWTKDESTTDQKREWIMTPFSLISEQQLERLGAGLPTMIVSRPSQSGGLDRPPSPATEFSSSSSKRRSVFVPPLVSILPDLTTLAYDIDLTVANAARVAIMDWMRHDPALIARPALDTLSARETSHLDASFAVLRGYLHSQKMLPPAMAHHMFNHVAGFLKSGAKQGEGEEALTGFSYAVPLLSKLVPQVSDMSLRELRRAKVDIFLIPSGSVWFHSSTPAGPMFPRSLSDITSASDSETILRLGRVVFIRVAQNLLFVNMLKRNHQDVLAVRKNMARLVLPITAPADDLSTSTERRFVFPKKDRTPSLKTAADDDISGLSVLLSRSHILLVTEIFRSLPRHLNDRNELAVLIDGLNQILLVHGNDIGIVAHALIAFMTASARFHRLFASGGGYTLFIPSLFKVYAESEPNAGVRHAIEYGINRFYAVHQEAFVFQALDVLSHVVMSPEVDGSWVALQVFLLLSTLQGSSPVYAADSAGIHGSNKIQEQEALMVRTAEEKPQTFLALLRRSSGSQSEDVDFAVPVQLEYESGHLTLDNFVRLLLTVIGHNPSIRRAEQFLRLLRLMASYLYDASSISRLVLQEGIYALGRIFIARSIGKARTGEDSQIHREVSSDSLPQAAEASFDVYEAASSPSNFVEMKFDYLSLVAEFSKLGGTFHQSALRHIFDLAKTMLKDSDPVGTERVASFLCSLAHHVLVGNKSDLQLKQVLTFLNELAPIFRTYATAADFSGVLEAVLRLAENPLYANEPTFSAVVVTQFCSPGLELFERLKSDGLASSSPLRPVLVRLLCRATLLTGTDVVDLIEQQPITFDFIAGILYPMALNLPSAAEIASDTRWMEAWRRAAIRRTWICLLQLAMQAFRGRRPASDRASQPERSRSQEKRGNIPKNSSAASLSMALQTLKVIVLKAEDELSISLPGIWVQMGSLLKDVLSLGDARFATLTLGVSVSSFLKESPVALSSRSSEDSDLLNPPSPGVDQFRFSSPPRPAFPRPSLLDYLLWSTLEFVCRHRSPLMLQMRLFLQEKTASLNEELRARQTLPGRNRRLSYTSVFSKTRQKSEHDSRGSSREASPFLAPLRPNHGDVLLTPPKPERMPGYARSPTTPGGSKVADPRIVHLGPVQNFDMLRRSPSPGSGESGAKSRKWLSAKSTTIMSARLALETYRRVRAVQRIMGYTDLLPMPDDVEGVTDDVRVWSKGTTLREIKDETGDLMGEFRLEDEEIMIK